MSNRKRKRLENYYSDESEISSDSNVLNQNMYMIILGLKKDLERLSNQNKEMLKELDSQKNKNKVLESRLKKLEKTIIKKKNENINEDIESSIEHIYNEIGNIMGELRITNQKPDNDYSYYT